MRRRSRAIVLLFALLIAVFSVRFARREAAAQRPANPPRPTTPAGRTTTTATAVTAMIAVDAAVSDASADATAMASADASARRCPAGMRLVEGEYCPTVDQRCLRWLDMDMPEAERLRCAEFARTRCLSPRRRHVAVCMDEYEAPNQRGAYPRVMVTWYQARRACESRGARLCTMAEWTFACEGEQMSPYLYGQQRDNTVCNVDHQTRMPDRPRLGNPATAADEAARLYEAAPSGQYNRCVSPFGIYDMTGNVDEWVQNETGRPFQSALKGGWWGPIRGRCRPVTLAHNESFIYYQIGYRCCADPQ